MQRSEFGQGGLFISAVMTMLAITFLGLSLSINSYMNARQAVATQQSSQLYYIAQAGVQEALASRFIPRNNYLNFLKYIGINTKNPPLYGRSGFVYADPLQPTPRNLIGVYRYLTLGGQGGVNVVSGQLTQEFLSSNQINQHFYLLSKGSVCIHKTTKAVGVGVISVINDGGVPRPACSDTNYVLDQLTLLTEANLSRANDPNYDQISAYRIYKTDSEIGLTSPVFVPGVNSSSQVSSGVSFEQAWNSGANFNTFAVKPVKIAFYSISDDYPTLDHIFNITSATTTISNSTLIDPRSVVRIFFSDGVDFRSLYIDPKNYEAIEADCLAGTANPENCNVRTRNLATNVIYNKSTVYPNLPGGSTLTLLPALGSGQVMQGNQQYQIELDPQISDWYGNALSSSSGTGYKIKFTTSSL